MAVLIALPALAEPAAAGRTANHPNHRLTGAAVALEGDLLSVAGTPVRLMGIDAPDPGQICRNRYGSPFDCHRIATGVLAALVEGNEVDCTIAERDRNGLFIGECRVRGFDLGGAMVARGWAFTYRSLTSTYQKSEAYAQSKRLGLWAGQVEKPWQWRSRKVREEAR
ncbi:thermonuclease family protein [Azospirillum halopraeferens]|uniref:thermonuclease family protein n=1 Tax=Azospirillum halopraeferens TaxID=34010 RepID=UPI00040BD4E3|nr:thermonuclease family protein [Azospirillum halopraeferens]